MPCIFCRAIRDVIVSFGSLAIVIIFFVLFKYTIYTYRGKIYYIYFDWNDKKETKIYHCGSLSDNKSGEPENIPLSKVSKFKVIKRLPFTDKNTGYTMVPKRTID